MPAPRRRTAPSASPAEPRHIAVVGAGMAGVACARTLVQAGHRVTLFEKSRGAGGRMATRRSDFGGFDHGAQFFTVRDPRFQQALDTVPGLTAPWRVNTVRVLDHLGQTMASAPPPREAHWVATPGMNALVKTWAAPLADGSLNAQTVLETQVTRLEADAVSPLRWQLRTQGPQGAQQVHGGFDQVVLAVPHPQAQALLRDSGLAPAWQTQLDAVAVAPCWTLMVAFPQATQAGAAGFGPRWHAARGDHHRIRWLARETSKPGRSPVERWTVQASPAWSAEHLEDDAERVTAKLLKGFAEITGIRAQPGHAAVHRWRYAQTQTPLGLPFLWDARQGLGLCGDWCLGYRVENAFVSGLELALAMA
ncbi:NAD(P)/FAD-dependent oxidoreductase [Aquabacterium sp. A08]|uniref:NAD(P)/FAD-dependent oxidoreductase n=1 Tax=Aquabacterium sp. A08 TaxID=2718532 RepID=UPI001420EC64|nr:FAD-dependent oxidoreductase [Aquabacterium sp. A08]NIC41555.1 NAD(P)-binding protein [Aquabacterium sp. A08]NIC42079.1 NAD(P)-binding protein [Aquabacterium sp. A08]NIC42128.1 NAD(P)-binding protein [Aquabacterium sp. A08]